jgi:hypothetical protein
VHISITICDSLDVVHGGDSSIGLSLLLVADESEATATAGVTVLDDNLTKVSE